MDDKLIKNLGINKTLIRTNEVLARIVPSPTTREEEPSYCLFEKYSETNLSLIPIIWEESNNPWPTRGGDASILPYENS